MFRRFGPLVLVPLVGVLLANPCTAQDRKSDVAARLGALPAVLLKEKRTDDELVNALFLATLMRLPDDGSRDCGRKLLQKAGYRRQACEDIIWACVNTREFMQLHGFTMAEASDISDRLSKQSEKK